MRNDAEGLRGLPHSVLIGCFGCLLAYLLPALWSKVEGRAICGADDDIRNTATAAFQYLIVFSFLRSFCQNSIDKMDEKQQLIGSLPVVNDISEQRAHAKKNSRWGTIKLVCLEITAPMTTLINICYRSQHAQLWLRSFIGPLSFLSCL